MSLKHKRTNKNNNQKKATKATHSLVSAKRAKSRQLRMSAARKLFLEAYEKTFGNISASCEYAGIHRSTLYRWLDSNSRVNAKFRRKFETIKPKEFQKDFIEAKFMQLVAEGVPSVVIYGAKTICGDRGFNERIYEQSQNDFIAEGSKNLKASIEKRARQKGVSYTEELKSFLENHSHLAKREIIDRLIKEEKSIL